MGETIVEYSDISMAASRDFIACQLAFRSAADGLIWGASAGFETPVFCRELPADIGQLPRDARDGRLGVGD